MRKMLVVLLIAMFVIVPLLSKIAHTDDCGVPKPDDCYCRKIYKSLNPDICGDCSGDCYAKAKLAYCNNGNPVWSFCESPAKGYSDSSCSNICGTGQHPCDNPTCAGETRESFCQEKGCSGAPCYYKKGTDGSICDSWYSDSSCTHKCSGSGGGGGGGGCDVSAPSSLSASPGFYKLNIHWTPGAASSQKFYLDSSKSKVQNNCQDGCLVKKENLPASDSARTVINLQPGTTYYYKIVSVKDCGSKASAVKSAKTKCDTSTPTSISAAPSFYDITIHWTPGTNDHQTLYLDSSKSKVQNNCQNGCLVKKTLGKHTKTYKASNLQPGTTYYYKIVSVKGCGSKASAVKSAKTKDPIAVNGAEFFNHQDYSHNPPPAVVRCYISQPIEDAVYLSPHAPGGRLNVQNGKIWVSFDPDLSKGEHTYTCHVDTSKYPAQQGKESASVSYTIYGPNVTVSASGGTFFEGATISSVASSEFFINSTTLFVDGTAVKTADYRGMYKKTVMPRWDIFLVPGSHVVSVNAKDYVGNTNEAEAVVNVSDQAASCSISPEIIESDTEINVTCYDTSGRETMCPEMSYEVAQKTPRA